MILSEVVSKLKTGMSFKRLGDMIYAEGRLKLNDEQITWFELGYRCLVIDYYTHPTLTFNSRNIAIERLDSFPMYKDGFVTQKNIYMPLIVGKMMVGDIVSYGLYREIYYILDMADLIIPFRDLVEDPDSPMMDTYQCLGGGISSHAMINSEHWLKSDEGKEILRDFEIDPSYIKRLYGEW